MLTTGADSSPSRSTVGTMMSDTEFAVMLQRSGLIQCAGRTCQSRLMSHTRIGKCNEESSKKCAQLHPR